NSELEQLLGPRCFWIARDVEVDDSSAVVRQEDQDAEHAKGRRGNGQEIDRYHLFDMVIGETAPGLSWLPSPFGQEQRNSALRHLDPELEQFPVVTQRAPERIGLRHLFDQGDNFGICFQYRQFSTLDSHTK